MFKIDVFTIFPQYIEVPASLSLLGKAQDRGFVNIAAHDIRNWSSSKTKRVDDTPYGGGAGMIMSAPPIVEAVEEVSPQGPVFLLSASGKKYDQQMAEKLAALPYGYSLICGRYEGVDERVSEIVCEDELCVGDYVLFGGEAAALNIIESTVRLLPEVVGNNDSIEEESFTQDLLEFPQYTRPQVYRGKEVPEVLLSGNHKEIEKWRFEQRKIKTSENRPDMKAEFEDK